MLKESVAVVAGATRGAGRGIARALAEAGAVVYCTGRSSTGNPSPYNRPETIDETAEMVASAGGTAIAVRVDHTVESEVEALFARVKREQGRLDILVDSVAGEDPLAGGWGSSFWQADLSNGEAALRQALLSHIITAKHAAPLLIEQKGGLIVEVTEGDTLMAGGNQISQTIKLALKTMALNMAAELKPHDVVAVSMSPGFLRSETMLEHFGVTEENWQDGGAKDKNFLESESPMFVGRAVAALAADENAMEKTGQLLNSWGLAREYGFTDVDGRRPDWGALQIDFSQLPPPMVDWMRTSAELQRNWLQAIDANTDRFLKRIP